MFFFEDILATLCVSTLQLSLLGKNCASSYRVHRLERTFLYDFFSSVMFLYYLSPGETCFFLQSWFICILNFIRGDHISVKVPGERSSFKCLGRMEGARFAHFAGWFGWCRASHQASEAGGRRSEQISRWCPQNAHGSNAAWGCNWMLSTADNQRSAEFSIQWGKEEATSWSWMKCKYHRVDSKEL